MRPEQEPGGYVRVLVSAEESATDASRDEWLWAEPLGSGRYRLESTPFFAYGLSRDDVVQAGGAGELPRVHEVERKSGHRTLRFALDPAWDVDAKEIQGVVEELLRLGCTSETMPPKIVALDVPPSVDVAAAVERLQAAVRAGLLVWEWADPRLS